MNDEINLKMQAMLCLFFLLAFNCCSPPVVKKKEVLKESDAGSVILPQEMSPKESKKCDVLIPVLCKNIKSDKDSVFSLPSRFNKQRCLIKSILCDKKFDSLKYLDPLLLHDLVFILPEEDEIYAFYKGKYGDEFELEMKKLFYGIDDTVCVVEEPYLYEMYNTRPALLKVFSNELLNFCKINYPTKVLIGCYLYKLGDSAVIKEFRVQRHKLDPPILDICTNILSNELPSLKIE